MATSTDQTQKTANNSTQAEVATNKAVPETAVEVSRSGTNNPAAVVVPGNEPAQTVQAFDGVEVDVKETETNAELVESFDEEAAIEELLSENPDGELPESAEGVLLAQADTADETAPAESGEASSAGSSAGAGAMGLGQIGLIGLGVAAVAVAADSDSDSSPAPAAGDDTAAAAGDFTITTGRGGLTTQASVVDDADLFDNNVDVSTGDYDGLVTAVISVENGTLGGGGGNTTLTAGDPTEATYVGSADGLEAAIQALTYTSAVTEAGTDTVSIDVTDNAGNTLANYEETISIGVVVTNADAVDGAVTGSAQADEFDLTQAEFAALTSIDGGDGIDGLELSAVNADITEAPTIENIDYVLFTAADAGVSPDIDTSVFTGVDFFVVESADANAGAADSSQGVALSELDGDETIVAGENFNLGGGNVAADTITFNLAEEQAASASLTVEANEFEGTLIAGTAGDDGEGVERMTVDVTETAVAGGFSVNGQTTLQELTLTGGDANDLNGDGTGARTNTVVTITGGDADAGLTVDASGFDVFADGASTPGVTLDVTLATGDLDLTGSDGDDTFTFGANDITADDSVDGGAGDDSLTSEIDGDIGAIDVSNVETVTLDAQSASTVDFANAQDIENLVLTADENHTLKNLNSQTAVEFSNTDFGSDVSLGLAAGDSHDVTFSDIDGTAAITNFKASESASSLSLTVNGDTTGGLTIATLTSENLETLTVDGTEDLVITNTVSSSVNTVDASESAGDVTVSAADATGAVTITGGDGGDTFTGGAEADTISGGDGADVLDGGAGDDTITGGAGADNIIGGAGADTIDVEEGSNFIQINALTDGSAATAAGGTFSGFDTYSNFDADGGDVLVFDSGDNTNGATMDTSIIDNAFVISSDDAATDANDLAADGSDRTDVDSVISFLTDSAAYNETASETDVVAVTFADSGDTAVYTVNNGTGTEAEAGEVTLLGIIDTVTAIDAADFVIA